MNQFKTIIAQLALQCINITEAKKKSLIIRWLPKSMSVISNVVCATLTTNMDAIDAISREEIEREDSPNTREGKSKAQPPANISQRV